MLRDELRRLVADQREVTTNESASDSCLALRAPCVGLAAVLRNAAAEDDESTIRPRGFAGRQPEHSRDPLGTELLLHDRLG